MSAPAANTDGFWSVDGKVCSGTAQALLGDGATHAMAVGFLITCPKVSHIRNNYAEASKVLSHVRSSTKRGGDPGEAECSSSPGEGCSDWKMVKLESLVRDHGKVMVRFESKDAADRLGVLEPVELLDRILRQTSSTRLGAGKKRKRKKNEARDVLSDLRYCQRFFPIQALCLCDEEGVKAAVTKILKESAKSEDSQQTVTKFAVCCKKRKTKVTTGDGKEKSVVDVLAETVKGESDWAVSLSDPDIVVMVEGPFACADAAPVLALCLCPRRMLDIKGKGITIRTTFK